MLRISFLVLRLSFWSRSTQREVQGADAPGNFFCTHSLPYFFPFTVVLPFSCRERSMKERQSAAVSPSQAVAFCTVPDPSSETVPPPNMACFNSVPHSPGRLSPLSSCPQGGRWEVASDLYPTEYASGQLPGEWRHDSPPLHPPHPPSPVPRGPRPHAGVADPNGGRRPHRLLRPHRSPPHRHPPRPLAALFALSKSEGKKHNRGRHSININQL